MKPFSKYEPLRRHLVAHPDDQHALCLTFAEIEKIIAARLPSSAYERRAWWGNQSDVSRRPQARAWREAGYIVSTLDQDRANGWVRFVRE